MATETTVREDDLIEDTRVAAGRGEDRDTGIIISRDDRDVLTIAWDSGVRTTISAREFPRLPNAEIL